MKRKSTVYRDIMTGVTHFIPFIVAGGMLISFAFLFDVKNASEATFGATNAVSAWLLNVGALAMGLMLPILAGYIAFSIADRPGLLAGMVAGLIARDGGSGFLGAIAGGFAAGYIIKLLKHLTKDFPISLEGAKTLIIFPVVGVILTGMAMIGVNFVVNPVMTVMNNFLANLSEGSAILLGAVIGAMVAFDMGGPVNKVAYLFCVASLAGDGGGTVATVPMASVGCAGMTIGTSCALATILFPKKFSAHLKDSGKAALIMGMSFIAEGAIPFAIEHPKEVIPSIMTGAAVAGGMAGLFEITLSAPIGGVFTVPLTSNIPLYLLCFVVGTLVSTFMMGTLLKEHVEEDED